MNGSSIHISACHLPRRIVRPPLSPLLAADKCEMLQDESIAREASGGTAEGHGRCCIHPAAIRTRTQCAPPAPRSLFTLAAPSINRDRSSPLAGRGTNIDLGAAAEARR